MYTTTSIGCCWEVADGRKRLQWFVVHRKIFKNVRRSEKFPSEIIFPLPSTLNIFHAEICEVDPEIIKNGDV